MTCEQCGEKLEIVRRCREIRLKCRGCRTEYQVHEVASRLDAETEEVLERYTAIIYD